MSATAPSQIAKFSIPPYSKIFFTSLPISVNKYKQQEQEFRNYLCRTPLLHCSWGSTAPNAIKHD